MFRHILFPIDFSGHCKNAVPFVKAFARQYGAKVTLMHVIHLPSGWYGGTPLIRAARVAVVLLVRLAGSSSADAIVSSDSSAFASRPYFDHQLEIEKAWFQRNRLSLTASDHLPLVADFKIAG
jgi:hypothetical protein